MCEFQQKQNFRYCFTSHIKVPSAGIVYMIEESDVILAFEPVQFTPQIQCERRGPCVKASCARCCISKILKVLFFASSIAFDRWSRSPSDLTHNHMEVNKKGVSLFCCSIVNSGSFYFGAYKSWYNLFIYLFNFFYISPGLQTQP